MLRNTIIYPVILFSILFSAPVYAEKYDDDSPSDLFCEPGRTAGNNPAFGGKPVSLVSGMETFAPSTDLSLGNLYPIRVTRSYNSVTSYDSPLGYGWAINYDKRLYTYPDDSVTVRRECGGKKRFTFQSPTGYVGQTGDTGTLTQNTTDGTFLYTDKNGDTEKYDSQGRLMSMADAKGNSLVFSYSAATRDFLWGLLPANISQSSSLIVAYDYHLSKIEEKDAAGTSTGSYVDLHYDASSGRLTDLTDSAGRTVTYSHDWIGNLTAVSGPSVNSAYGYTDPFGNHHLTSIDEGNGAYVNTYDSHGRVTRQTHGTGIINFTYIIPFQKTLQTTLIKDGSGNLLYTQTKTVEFDANRVPIKVTDTFGNITNYVRDSAYRILQKSITDFATSITTITAYTYDAKGNELTRTEALGTTIEKTTAYTYDPLYSRVLTETVKSVADPNQNKVITNTYDATGNLLTTTDAGLLGNGTAYSYTTTYAYYADNKLQSIDGPRTDVSDTTSYTYAETTGFLASTTQPLIGTTTYSNHDPLGNPRTVTDPNGNSTIYTYDVNGRVLTVTAPGDTNPTQYFYVAGGCSSCGGANKIDHITLPEGNSIWYTYSAMGNLASISDSLGNSINYTYDSEGNKLTEEIRDAGNSLQKSLSYSYDALNRLLKITNPDSNYTLYGYDGFGNKKSVKDPNNKTTTYGYDALDRLATVLQPGTVITAYGYNSNNNLTTVTDANNNTTTYIYDDRGRVYQVTSPDTGTTSYIYDPAGNLLTKTDAKGITISYSYDALNRLTTIDYPADTDTVYSYDTCVNGKGRLCSIADASGTTEYEYTPKGQVKKETKVIDTVQYVTQYTYDMNGNTKTMTYPSGKVITYNYTNDRAVSVLNGAVNLASNIAYKPFGGMKAITYGNGLSGTIGYDNQYRISSITTGAVLSLSYTGYDSNGNITAITNSLDTTKNKSFTYDNLDRLGTATSSGIWGSLAWTYDGVGNRQTENANAYTYFQNTNKLNTANGISFGYDNDGNTTTEAARQYVYNQNQRLIQVNDGSMTANYTYNGNGQRVKKVVNETTTIFHYSLSGQIIAESNSAGTIAVEYVYFNGQPLAKMMGANTYYYHNDHLATPQKMTDSSGQVVWSADYKPFGEATVTVSTITNNLRFPGQYYDAETGLHYNLNRTYNTALDRYIESDSVGIQGGKNHLYIYAVDNPIRYVDPDGLHAWPDSQGEDCSNTSPKCDKYGTCEEYSGANASCFCKCAGNDRWSQTVRCCLRTKRDQGMGMNAAHWYCYAYATSHTGPPPATSLAECYSKCSKYQDILCPTCPPKFTKG